MLKFESEAVETHLRRVDSFRSRESVLAQDMLKGSEASRSGNRLSGESIVSWLQERNGTDMAAALRFAEHMLSLGILKRAGGGPPKMERGAQYEVLPDARPPAV